MAVQQNKVSKSRRNNRRAHDALVAGNPNECANCGELKRPHHVCGPAAIMPAARSWRSPTRSTWTKTRHELSARSTGPSRPTAP